MNNWEIAEWTDDNENRLLELEAMDWKEVQALGLDTELVSLRVKKRDFEKRARRLRPNDPHITCCASCRKLQRKEMSGKFIDVALLQTGGR